MSLNTLIIQAYKEIQDKVQQLASQFQNDPTKILILPVSKTRSAEEIMVLYNIGVRDFAENKVQELLEKKASLPGDINWHLIGHLQTNKVKYIADFVYLIHSVDRLSLVDELVKQARKADRQLSILIQVRIASEETKFGCQPDQLDDLVQYCQDNKEWIQVKGFMTMATFTDNMNQLEQEYSLFQSIIKPYQSTCGGWVSAGMTNDYEIALHHGANMIRIGTAIFGERQN